MDELWIKQKCIPNSQILNKEMCSIIERIQFHLFLSFLKCRTKCPQILLRGHLGVGFTLFLAHLSTQCISNLNPLPNLTPS